MSTTIHPFRFLSALIAALTAAGLVAGCAHEEPAPPPPPAAEEATETRGPDVYDVRGVVVSVTDPDDPSSTFSIRHEAIDEYRGPDGEIFGMDSMTMPFPLADGVSLESLEPGDKIRFDLQVDHDGDRPMLITGIEELAPETELVYGKARPPEGDEPR